jgi:FtsP/CotA-like multicopper oxidase with cupredoxin domain
MFHSGMRLRGRFSESGRSARLIAAAGAISYGAALLFVLSHRGISDPGAGRSSLVVDWLSDGTLLLVGVLPTVWLGAALFDRVRKRATRPKSTPVSAEVPEPPAASSDWQRRTSRRGFVKYGVAGIAAVGYGGAAWRASADNSFRPLLDLTAACRNNSPVGPPFTQALPIPPALPPFQQTADADFFRLAERQTVAQIVPGVNTPMWGYNGLVPGPTILARKGRRAEVTFTNQLPPNAENTGYINPNPQDPQTHPFIPSSTVVHLHGINAEHASDGYPEERRTFGQSFTHHYPNNEYQRPATLWYHDHSVHITSDHLYRGLAATYILTDEAEDASGLPGTLAADGPGGYGRYDIPLMLSDKMIDPGTGNLVYDYCDEHGAYGDVMAVNGKQQPRLDVANRKYRFRFVTASDSRQWLLALRTVSNLKRDVQDPVNEPFFLIGTGQGLLTGPALQTDRFHTAPSERYEIVIDFSKYPVGTRLVLVNLLVDPQDPKLFPVMAFDVTRVEPDPSRIPPGPLRPPEHPADTQAPTQFRLFEFNRSNSNFTINEKRWNPARVDAFPILNTTEEWTLRNDSGGWGHPVHIHLGRFRVVDIKGRDPRPGELSGFKDVVWVGPNQQVTVRHQFWNFTGRFVFHCHNGTHEDNDMMSQFEVVPG